MIALGNVDADQAFWLQELVRGRAAGKEAQVADVYLELLELASKGGPGSGNFGHEGRLGVVRTNLHGSDGQVMRM